MTKEDTVSKKIDYPTTNTTDDIVTLLLERKKSKSKPKGREDHFHIALVIEGGGMRGVAAGGMVSGLEDLDLLEAFDSVHGSSAGAATGAYFVAGQGNFGTRMFYENINNDDFINPKRIFKGKAIMDTHFLVDGVMKEDKALDFEKIQMSLVPLHIITTDIDNGKALEYSKFENYEHYRKILKASITMPFIGGKATKLNNTRLLDGGLVQQIAIKSALDAGATHVLALLTRREDELIRPEPNFKSRLESLFLKAVYGGKIFDLYMKRNGAINNDITTLRQGFHKDYEAKIGYIPLPSSIDYIHRLTKDDKALREAAHETKKSVLNIFNRSQTI